MKLTKFRLSSSKLATRNPPTLNHSFCLKMSQVFRRAFAKGDVAHARLQITPCMVNVHLMAPRNSGQASYILEGDSADGLPRRNSVVQAFAGLLRSCHPTKPRD